MTHLAYHRCPDCGERATLELDTRDGRLVETLTAGCEHERKRRGVCRYCTRAVVGRLGLAMYCERHRTEARRRTQRLSKRRQYAADPERQRARVRKRRRENPEILERDIQRLHAYTRSPEWDTGGEKYLAALARRRGRYASDPELRARDRKRQAAYRARKRKEGSA